MGGVVSFKRIEDFLQEADLKKNSRQEKLSNKRKLYLAVYLTAEEKEKVNRYARQQGISASTLIRILLRKEGIL